MDNVHTLNKCVFLIQLWWSLVTVLPLEHSLLLKPAFYCIQMTKQKDNTSAFDLSHYIFRPIFVHLSLNGPLKAAYCAFFVIKDDNNT